MFQFVNNIVLILHNNDNRNMFFCRYHLIKRSVNANKLKEEPWVININN